MNDVERARILFAIVKELAWALTDVRLLRNRTQVDLAYQRARAHATDAWLVFKPELTEPEPLDELARNLVSYGLGVAPHGSIADLTNDLIAFISKEG